MFTHLGTTWSDKCLTCTRARSYSRVCMATRGSAVEARPPNCRRCNQSPLTPVNNVGYVLKNDLKSKRPIFTIALVNDSIMLPDPFKECVFRLLVEK